MESVINKLDNKDTKSIKEDYPKIKSDIESSIYDGETAINIRKKAGLSKAELSRELGLSRAGYNQLRDYEAGKNKPRNPPKGKVSKKYFRWLKKQGYNPFKI